MKAAIHINPQSVLFHLFLLDSLQKGLCFLKRTKALVLRSRKAMDTCPAFIPGSENTGFSSFSYCIKFCCHMPTTALQRLPFILYRNPFRALCGTSKIPFSNINFNIPGTKKDARKKGCPRFPGASLLIPILYHFPYSEAKEKSSVIFLTSLRRMSSGYFRHCTHCCRYRLLYRYWTWCSP